MKHRIALIALLFSFGCGSGGGPGQPPGGGGLTVAQVIAALNTCSIPDLEDWLDLLEAFAPVLGNPGANPDIVVGPLAAHEVPYSLDFNNDMVDDVVGVFSFTDSAGAPVFPFAPEDIAAGFPGLLAVLPSLPDGTHLRINFNVVRTDSMTGFLDLLFSGGAITSIDGSTHSQGSDCTVDFDFQGALPADLRASFPDGVLDADITTPLGSGTGTVTFDGTNTALISITVAGQGPFRMLLNLVTGALTPAP